MGVKVSDFGYCSYRAAQDPETMRRIKDRNEALSGGLLPDPAPPAPGPYWSLVWAQTLL